jgi:8-oxo-dGTP diphosphatase
VPKLLTVVAGALVDDRARVLVQQRAPGRSMAGLWEFPGGKLEPDETPEDALARELREELGIEVAPADMSPVTFASAPLGERHLVLLLFLIREWRGEPRALDASALRWEPVGALRSLAMPPADVPLVDALEGLLRAGA